MNRLFYVLLSTLIICPAVQAIDIKTDASCKKLVTAIKQAQTVEKCTAAWQTITASAAITTQDRAAIVDQALQLAQEQKSALEQELANLGDKTRNYSKLKWGAGQLAAGAYVTIGELFILYMVAYNSQDIPDDDCLPVDYNRGAAFFNITDKFAKMLFGPMLQSGFTALRFLAINPIVGFYCFEKAYHNIKQGLNYKKFLQDNIANLDAIISYLQEVQRIN
jgi:hypothetical protein